MRFASSGLVPVMVVTSLALTAGVMMASAPGCSTTTRNFGDTGGGTTTSTTSTTSTTTQTTGTTTSTGGTGGTGTATGGTGTGGGTGGTGTGGGTGGTGTGGQATGGSGTGGTGGTGWCNPFTSTPCDIAGGFACDFNGAGFQCFGPPNTEVLCAPCGFAAGGAYCQPGMTCSGTYNVCVRFCCANNDCGSGGICDLTALGSTGIGVCLKDSEGDGVADSPACNVPLVQPSGGSCFTP